MSEPRKQTSAVERVQAAMPKRNVLDDLLEAYSGDFGAVMPEHVTMETFVGLAVAYVRRDKFLSMAAVANPDSLVLALREIAAWGHVPMKGVAALVAFKSDRARHPEHNGFQITAIEEVGGVIQRIFRAGAVTAVHAEVVRDKDYCKFNRTKMVLPDHDYDENADPKDRGPLKAVYAYATMQNGQPSTVVYMPRAVVMKHRNISRSGDNFWGPPDGEGPWTEDMWKKTALHKLSGLLPTSASYRQRIASVEAAAARQGKFADRPVTPEAGGDYIDVEYVDPPGNGLAHQ
jgi:recombination protein RecT